MENKTLLQKKIVYETTKTMKEFEEAKEKLTGVKYTSVMAEKRRWWKKKFTLKGYLDEEGAKNKFVKLTASIVQSYNLNLTETELINKGYFFNKKNKNMYKITYLQTEYSMMVEYIFQDTYYCDYFEIEDINKPKKKFIISKQLMLPVTLDNTSMRAHAVRVHMWNEFRKYKKEITKGVGI